jgi:predicted DNA-binding transcriptional regulator AlpA
MRHDKRDIAMTPRTQLVSLREVSDWLKVSPATLFRFIRAGKLTPIKLGRRTMFSANEVEELIAASRVPRGKQLPKEKLGKITVDHDRVFGALRKADLICEPTKDMLAHAAAWDALPEEEKQEVILVLDDLRLEPLLSETIIRSRERGLS